MVGFGYTGSARGDFLHGFFLPFCAFWEFQRCPFWQFCNSIGILKVFLFKGFCVLLLSQGACVRGENHFLLVFHAVIVLLPENARDRGRPSRRGVN